MIGYPDAETEEIALASSSNAMHLIRLLMTVIDILERQEIHSQVIALAASMLSWECF